MTDKTASRVRHAVVELRDETWLRSPPKVTSETLAQDPKLADYKKAIEREARETNVDQATAQSFFDGAWRMYSEEEARRESLNNRAAGVLAAAGGLVAVVLALGPSALSDRSSWIWQTVIGAPIVVALAYTLLAIKLAIEVHRPVVSHTIGPEETLPTHLMGPHPEGTYSHRMAIEVVKAASGNYPINGRRADQLQVGLRALRNAIIVLIVVAGLAATLPKRAETDTSCSVQVIPGQTTARALLAALELAQQRCDPKEGSS